MLPSFAMSEQPRRDSPLAVLRNPNFRMYWGGQAISLVGTWMQVVAQSFVVIHLSRLNSSLALIQLASSIPMILLSLSGGSLADSADRRKILIATQIALMLLAFAFAGLIHYGHIGLITIMVIAVLAGTAAAFDLPASQAFTPQLVEPHQIPQAVALMQAIFHGSRLLGPALAGILMGPFGPEGVFIANGVSFVAVIGTLLWIRPAVRQRRPGAGGARISDGVRYVLSRGDVRALMAITALGAIFIFPFMIVLGAGFIKEFYAGRADALGLLMAASGAGALLGSIGLLGTGDEVRMRRIVICTLGMGLALMGYGLSRQLPVTLACVFVLTFNVSTSMGHVSTILQQTVPDELRGRVMSINTLMFIGLTPFAALGLGAASDRVGLAAVMLGAGGLHCVLATLVLPNAVRARRMVSSKS